MSEPFLAEIVMFGGNFAPRAWAFCDGQLLPISQNSALFSLLGTIYGGDGRTTFALPDIRGRTPIHAGNGPGLSDRRLGAKGGQENTVQNVLTMANHSHTVSATYTAPSASGGTATPNSAGAQLAALAPGNNYVTGGSAGRPFAANPVTVTELPAGGGQSETNMQPWIAVNYIIALQGIFPSRN